MVDLQKESVAEHFPGWTVDSLKSLRTRLYKEARDFKSRRCQTGGGQLLSGSYESLLEELVDLGRLADMSPCLVKTATKVVIDGGSQPSMMRSSQTIFRDEDCLSSDMVAAVGDHKKSKLDDVSYSGERGHSK